EVRGELDWIVMKCLEKDRNRRYQTASGLAQDIERFLNEEPIEAGPPSPVYRLRKFAGKNRKWLAAAATFVLLLAGGAGVSTWQAVRARSAEKDALLARDDEAEQRRQAERSEGRARSAEKQALAARDSEAEQRKQAQESEGRAKAVLQ